jgi:septal ring factor EnvC (AmiA/AmiB activator)
MADEKGLEARMRDVEDTLARIETKLDASLKNIDDHEARLRALEGKGGKRWETLVGQIIGLAAAGFIGWLLGTL